MNANIPSWQCIKLSQEKGVVEVVLHRNGGSMVWDAVIHRELTELFAWLAFNRTSKVLLLTGTGDAFCSELDSTDLRDMPWREIWSEGSRLINGLLNLDMLVVTAVNGIASIHSEIAVMADVVLACPEASFADHAHFGRDVVPGDGIYSIWARLLGPTRASYFLLTGDNLSSEEALRLGVVHEIHPRSELLPRARELAKSLARKSAATVEYSRTIFQARNRHEIGNEVRYGLAAEGLAQHAMGLRNPEKSE